MRKFHIKIKKNKYNKYKIILFLLFLFVSSFAHPIAVKTSVLNSNFLNNFKEEFDNIEIPIIESDIEFYWENVSNNLILKSKNNKYYEEFEKSISLLKKKIKESNNQELKDYFNKILLRKDNKKIKIFITNSEKLGNLNSIRRFNVNTNISEIFFNIKFLEKTPELLILEIFHRLGNYNIPFMPFSKALEETKLLIKDIMLVNELFKEKNIDKKNYRIKFINQVKKEANKKNKKEKNKINKIENIRKIALDKICESKDFKKEYNLLGYREYIIKTNKHLLLKIFGNKYNKKIKETKKYYYDEMKINFTENEILLGVLGRESILDKQDNWQKELLKEYRKKQTALIIGGDGSLNTSYPAFMNLKNWQTVISQPITDNGERVGKQIVDISPCYGRTYGIEDELGAITNVFLKHIKRKIFSNFTIKKFSFRKYEYKLNEFLVNIIDKEFRGIIDEENALIFFIDQINMLRIIDILFSGSMFEEESSVSDIYNKEFAVNKSIRNLNELAMVIELGGFLSLDIYKENFNKDDIGKVDKKQVSLAIRKLEENYGISNNCHVVASGLSPATLEVFYERPITEEELENIKKEIGKLYGKKGKTKGKEYEKKLKELLIKNDKQEIIGLIGEFLIGKYKGNKIKSFKIIVSENQRNQENLVINSELKKWIENPSTKKIIIGPGSFFSTILSQFFPGILEALKEAKKNRKNNLEIIWFFHHVNTEETSNYELEDYIKMIGKTISNKDFVSLEYIKELSLEKKCKYEIKDNIYVYKGTDIPFVQLYDIVDSVIINKTITKDIDDYIKENQLEEYGYDENKLRKLKLSFEMDELGAINGKEKEISFFTKIFNQIKKKLIKIFYENEKYYYQNSKLMPCYIGPFVNEKGIINDNFLKKYSTKLAQDIRNKNEKIEYFLINHKNGNEYYPQLIDENGKDVFKLDKSSPYFLEYIPKNNNKFWTEYELEIEKKTIYPSNYAYYNRYVKFFFDYLKDEESKKILKKIFTEKEICLELRSDKSADKDLHNRKNAEVNIEKIINNVNYNEKTKQYSLEKLSILEKKDFYQLIRRLSAFEQHSYLEHHRSELGRWEAPIYLSEDLKKEFKDKHIKFYNISIIGSSMKPLRASKQIAQESLSSAISSGRIKYLFKKQLEFKNDMSDSCYLDFQKDKDYKYVKGKKFISVLNIDNFVIEKIEDIEVTLVPRDENNLPQISNVCSIFYFPNETNKRKVRILIDEDFFKMKGYDILKKFIINYQKYKQDELIKDSRFYRKIDYSKKELIEYRALFDKNATVFALKNLTGKELEKLEKEIEEYYTSENFTSNDEENQNIKDPNFKRINTIFTKEELITLENIKSIIEIKKILIKNIIIKTLQNKNVSDNMDERLKDIFNPEVLTLGSEEDTFIYNSLLAMYS